VPEDRTVPAFPYQGPRGRMSLTHDMIVQVAKDMAELMGMNPDDCAGHSFRRGGATWAFQMGVPEILVQRLGDWLSACYTEYIVLSREQALQATRLMLQGMDMSRTEWQARTMPAGVQPDEHLPDELRQAARSMIAPVGA
jgi:hypothetical protein